jgi:hypothetical protein
VTQTQAASKLLKHALAPRNYGQRLELAEGSSLRGLFYHFSHKTGFIYSTPQHLRVLFFSCCGSVAALPPLTNFDEFVAKTSTS